jgi:acyl-CoA synthetase (AMP-forming)/AMP-acid ligase II
MELLERISRFAKESPSRLAYVQPDGRQLTYASLDLAIGVVKRAIRESPAREPIVLDQGNTIDFVVNFLSTIAAGIDAPVVAASTSQAEQATFAARLAGKASAKEVGDLLLLTSGSTGTQKIVRRDAASLDAVAASMVEAIGFRADDRVLAAIPLAHSYGIEHGLLAPLWAGATVHLFDGLGIDAIAGTREPFDIFPAVPSMLERLADAGPALDGLRSLRTIYSAGAPLPDSVRERFVARFGRPVGQLYGSTEIGTVTYRSGDARAGNDVGWPMRSVSIRTLDTGEIAIKSPSMFSGYVDEPAELIDGHFLTGDLGRLTSDGALELSGRSKLLIDVGGLKVNPLEVEAAIASHAAVAECVVLPVTQSETVQRLRAIIVPRNPALPPTIELIRAHTRTLLAPHKVPRSFEIRAAALPRSATGKLLRTMVDDS